jgi:hypothetical protein
VLVGRFGMPEALNADTALEFRNRTWAERRKAASWALSLSPALERLAFLELRGSSAIVYIYIYIYILQPAELT